MARGVSPDRSTWIVAVVVAAAVAAGFFVVEQATGQQGVFMVGLVVAGGVLVFVGAVSSVMGQAHCEECGIGNPADAKECWKCGAPLVPRDPGGGQGPGRTQK